MRHDRSGEVIVVGAGIAGLAAAHRLAAVGIQVRVLEAAGVAGGRMSTRVVGGGLMERGAQFLSTGYDVVPELLRTVGLADQVVEVCGQSLVIADEGVWPFDIGHPQSLLSGGLLRVRDVVPAARGRWSTRMLAARPTGDLGRWSDLDGQSGLEWSRARFGPGLTDRLISPTVHGLYFQELGANSAALPGALSAFSARVARAFTLRGGLATLPAALAARLDVEYDTRVERVQRPGGSGGRVTLATSRGPREATAVVIATPAGPTRTMLSDPSQDEAAVLRATYSSGLVVGLALAEPLAEDELGGAYGVLVASDSSSPLAAVAVFSRADVTAGGGEVLTVMFRSEVAQRLRPGDDAAVRSAAIDAVGPWLPGLPDRVIDSQVARWQEAMPHVPVGHATAVQRYRDRLPAGSPVVLAGDYLGFPWSDAAAVNGRWAADRLIADQAGEGLTGRPLPQQTE